MSVSILSYDFIGMNHFMSETLRVFFAIMLPPAIEALIAELMSELQKTIPPEQVRWTPLKNLHITLQFLPNISAADLKKLTQFIEQELKDIGIFDLKINKLELFPSCEKPRFISLHVIADRVLKNLVQQLSSLVERLNYPIEQRPFRAHITLGRFRDAQSPKNSIAHIQLPQFNPCSIDKISLLQSRPGREHSDYQLLKQFPLK